jgi:hypothetical protein
MIGSERGSQDLSNGTQYAHYFSVFTSTVHGLHTLHPSSYEVEMKKKRMKIFVLGVDSCTLERTHGIIHHEYT